MTSFLLDVKFWQMDHMFSLRLFLANFLLRMRTNGHNCTSGLNVDPKIKFSVPSFVENLIFLPIWPRLGPFLATCRFVFTVPDFLYGGSFRNWARISGILANFLLRMHRNGQNYTSGQFLTPKLKFPCAVSYSYTNFGGASTKVYARF